MPKEAAGRLATRLSAKIAIEEREILGRTTSELISEWQLKRKGIPPKRPRRSINEEAEEDWNVKHGRAQSSLQEHMARFKFALLTLKERLALEAAREKIFWTHPEILARLKSIGRFKQNPQLLDQMTQKFSSGTPVEDPFSYYFSHSEYLDTEPRQKNLMGNLHDVAQNLAYQQQGGEILSRLESLCREIAQQRKKQKSPVQFSIKVNEGTTKFKPITTATKTRRRTREYWPELPSIKVVFRKAGK